MNIRALATALSVLQCGFAVVAQPRPARTQNPKPNTHSRALLIAVSGYARPGKPDAQTYSELNTAADVTLLRQQLIRKFRFAPGNITTLSTPGQTTRKSILDAMARLTSETKPGETVYFHFSGHGSQIPNDDSHENNTLSGERDPEPDGLDETLVPSDYASATHETRACNDIRDDDLALFLDALAKKKPADVFLSFDCCHSGTITRGGHLTRGHRYSGPTPKPGAFPKSGGTTRAGLRGGDVSETREPLARTFVALSAARSDESALETDDDSGKPMGALTYALAKAMESATPTTTYRTLVEQTRATLLHRSPQQTPEAEGQLDRRVFSGAATPVDRRISVTRGENGTVRLDAGFLQGIGPGSTVDLFASDARADALAIGRATVKDAQPVSATLTIEGANAIGKRLEGGQILRAEVRERQTRATPLTVKIDLPENSNAFREARAAVAALQARGLVRSETQARWDVSLSARGSEWVLLAPDGKMLRTLGPLATPETARVGIEAEARRRLFLALQNDGTEDDVRIELRLVPMEVTVDSSGAVSSWKEKPVDGSGGKTLSVRAGDWVKLELRNTGALGAYVTVLNLDSDGVLGAIWPYPGLAQSNFVPVGKNKPWFAPLRPDNGQPYLFRIGGSAGRDVYRAIATAERSDFSVLLSDTRPGQTALQRLVQQTTGARVDRAGVAAPAGGWATAAFVIEIVG